MPQIVFSLPEAASVGLTMDQAKAREDLVGVGETVYPMMGNARMMMSDAAGSLSVVTGADADDPDTQRVLGVHMVAPDASDLIVEAQQLVGNRVPLTQAARLIHPHIRTPHSRRRWARRCSRPTAARCTRDRPVLSPCC